ncbi:MAG: Zn-dependent hydrolase [Acidobacteria bacterium]|nr:Zn-dependent hydrolase [Acidobacteriota bacterium]
MKLRSTYLAALGSCVLLAACATSETDSAAPEEVISGSHVDERLAIYTEVELAPDLSELTDSQRQVVTLLVEAAQAVDEIYWQQAYGSRDELLAGLPAAERRFAEINFGPWDRLDDNAPFLPGVGDKPQGANFYPADATRVEVEEASEDVQSLYTMVERDEDGALTAVPYHDAFATQNAIVIAKLREAASTTENTQLQAYLEARANALGTDDYRASDIAWMNMKTNTVEVIIGPIETYEDQLMGTKAAHEALVLIKDMEWSQRLARYSDLLPALQDTLPVSEEYRAEEPGTEAELNAYDLAFVAGDGNAGSKSIAVNLPNDESVQLEKGTRRLQIKNAMRSKFDAILMPISEELIAPGQRQHVTFDAFFANTMFHEVAHGLGIKNTITGNGTVRSALQDHASWVEEGKADILGLHMITELHANGELGDADLMDNYVTFAASMFRSIRFGGTSAHGRANRVRFAHFEEQGALLRDDPGIYSVDFEAMQAAMRALGEAILTMQGNGDRDTVQAFWDRWGVIGPNLEEALATLADRDIPVDIVYRQGLEVLGLR